MGFDRSKYKKANLDEIDESMKSAESTMKNPMFSNQGGRASFFSVGNEGRYIIRFLPAPEEQKPYVPRKTVKLPIECPVYDKDGKDTGKKEVRPKDVFTSDIHSNRMGGKDAVLIYIDYVYNLASEIQDVDERKKFLSPITGYRNKQKQWVWGASPNLNYVSYIYAEEEIHRFDIRPQWWKKMKTMSVERSNDDVINIDIFSDPDNGYPLIINASKDDKNKMQYDLSCDLPKVNESWDEFFKRTSVSDSILEALEELPSLEDQYVDVFSRKDWDMQLEGLERLDKQAGYDIFQDDQFLSELEELEKLVPEDNEVKEAAKIPTQTKEPAKSVESKKTQVQQRSSSTQDTTKTYPPLIKMKSELNEYIEREYEGTEVLPSLPLIEMRKWYDLMKEGMMLPFEDYKTNEESVDDLPFEEGVSEEERDEAPIKQSVRNSHVVKDATDRLKALRELQKKRK